VRELPDREDVDQVEEQLERGDHALRAGRQRDGDPHRRDPRPALFRLVVERRRGAGGVARPRRRRASGVVSHRRHQISHSAHARHRDRDIARAVPPIPSHLESRGMTNNNTPTVVLVHGGFADASFWTPVVRELQASRLPVLAPANPPRGLASDAEYLASFVSQSTSPFCWSAIRTAAPSSRSLARRRQRGRARVRRRVHPR
jgi:hypothetical protein